MEHILLLHGAIGAKNQLETISAGLQNNFIVHTLDFSGHGSAAMSDKFSIPGFAEDVIKYLESNKIESINIFGYSMGGYVALYLAARHPEKVRSVFTFATKFLWTPEIALKEIKMLDPEKISEKLPAFAAILKKRHSANGWKIVLQKTQEMMVEMGQTNPLTESDLEKIEQRILIGIGDRDTMVTLEETINVYRQLRNASLVVFPETQHPIEKVDQSRLTAEIVLFFR
ncbi:MAG: alpha/beta hydrolase [Bacteroidota bacterium]|jgi:pimeloyl-ACP methyl ester carboxylesterase|nr:alpha/beta hydrolase [Bacteroidota bacterium]